MFKVRSDVIFFLIYCIFNLYYSNEPSSAAAEDAETKVPAQPRSPSQGPDKISSGEVEVSSSVTNDYNESMVEVAPGSQPHPVAHTSSNYGFGFIPQILGSQLPNSDNSESQARDAPRLPGFVVCSHASFICSFPIFITFCVNC